MAELLRLEDVSKGYARGDRRLRILTDVSLTLGRGEIGVVVGSRLEGKTTLLKIAGGFELPDSGKVWMAGQELTAMPASAREKLWGREISWVHSEGTWLGLEAREYVSLPLHMSRTRPSDCEERAMNALERVGAADLARRRWEELSNWERLLVGFARSIVSRPQLIVIDDLLDGFGMGRTNEAGGLLRSLVVDLDCAALVSGSDDEVAVEADRLWSFDRGRLSADYGGTVVEFPDAGLRMRSSSI
jgi:ABC-type lipoprotein export system ATPase subunit